MKKTIKFLFLFLIVGLSAFGQETQLYFTGFENAEGFTAGTTYNNATVAYTGPASYQWGTVFGTPSTTSPISGAQSMQMRWYTGTPANLGYTYTNFDMANVTKVTFLASSTSALNVVVSYSTDGGTNFVGDSLIIVGSTKAAYTYKVSTTGQYANVRLKFMISLPTPAPSTTSRLYIDSVTVFYMNTSPTLTLTPTTLSPFTYVEGNGPSAVQSFAVAGSNLTSDVTIALPTNYELSTDNFTTTASSDITLTPTSGSVNQTIYVRLKAGLLNANSPFNETLTVANTDAGNKTIALNGTVTAPTPAITIVSPADAATLTSTSVNVTYTVANAPVDAVYKYFLNVDVTGVTFTSSPISITALEGSNTITLKMYQADGTTLITSDAVTFNVVLPAAPTKIVITNVTPASPFVNTTFSLTVQAQDASNNPQNVSADETITLTDASSNGVLSGTLTGTITIGSNSVTFTNLSYDFVETVAIQAQSTTLGNAEQLVAVQAQPTITVTPATLSGFTYEEGNGPSAVQSFVVSGADLTNDITIALPTKYELSLSNSPFTAVSANVVLQQTTGTVANTTIYVRLKAGLTVGDQDETINITSTGATAKTVACTGTVALHISTIAEARALTVGSVVKVKGIVLNGSELTTNRYIEDATGGIDAYSSTLSTVAIGDEVTITGTLNNFSNLLELSPVASFTVNSNSNTLPDAKLVTITTAKEQYESQLVKLTNVHFVVADTFKASTNYKVTDGTTDTIIARTSTGSIVGDSLPKGNVTITTVLGQHSSTANDVTTGYQLMLRTSTDFQYVKITSPSNNSTITLSNLDIAYAATNPENGVVYSYVLDSGSPVATTSSPVSLTNLANGNHTFVLSMIDANSNVLSTASLAFTVNLTGLNDVNNQVSVYPNPASDVVTLSNNVVKATVFNALGQAQNVQLIDNVINVSKLSAGVYTIRMTLNNGSVVNQKIIKK